MSSSSLLTTSGSIFRLRSCFCPSISTLTTPPPAVASTTRAAISACMRSCACWSCFISFRGSPPKGFTNPPWKAWPPGRRRHGPRRDRAPPVRPARARPPRAASDAGPRPRPASRGLVRGGRRAGLDRHRERLARGLAGEIAILVRVQLRERHEVRGDLEHERLALDARRRRAQRRRERGARLAQTDHRAQDGAGRGLRRRRRGSAACAAALPPAGRTAGRRCRLAGRRARGRHRSRGRAPSQGQPTPGGEPARGRRAGSARRRAAPRRRGARPARPARRTGSAGASAPA